MRREAYPRLALAIVLVAWPLGVGAHHSAQAIYDVGTVREIEGTITRVLWQNPHVRFTIRTRDARGGEELWNVETQSVSILRRMEIPPDILKVGERVRVAGNPARSRASDILARNVLLGDGREVVLEPRATARWSKRTLGKPDTWLTTAGTASDPKRGIFRVWSTSLSAPGLFADPATYPLTPAARAALNRFDPIRDNPLRDCAPKGMPAIMSPPYPIEFVQQGGDIVLRIEEYDTVRTIHMGGDTGSRPAPTLLGRSVGHWQGNTLMVVTSGSNWRRFTTTGVPLSEAAEMVERFTPSTDGSRLDYEMTVTDPATFTKPVVLKKQWIWLPDARVSPYVCTNGR